MPLEIVTVATLQDNYNFLIHDSDSGQTVCIDCGDPEPILAALKARDWALNEVWLTHHHWDHADTAPALCAATGALLKGAAQDSHRLPALDHMAVPGEDFEFAGHRVQVLDAVGHTSAHIAYYIEAAPALFSADSLMVLGCGRLFEGNPAQMFDTLLRFAALPAETLVCAGHEYTANNGKFALTVDPENSALISRCEQVAALREKSLPTVPSLLSEELATNPFLRCDSAAIRRQINMADASDLEVFTEIRARKDRF